MRWGIKDFLIAVNFFFGDLFFVKRDFYCRTFDRSYYRKLETISFRTKYEPCVYMCGFYWKNMMRDFRGAYCAIHVARDFRGARFTVERDFRGARFSDARF